MKCLLSQTLNPYFNLALEEYLLHSDVGDVFYIWRSTDSIVVGKHQNTLAEINYAFACKEQIPVLRRLSGGGTVYHDTGNINFTFIRNRKNKEELVNFRSFMQPVMDILQGMNLQPHFSDRNDIFIADKKISGNAEHVFAVQKRTLHHGTLLFDSNLSKLSEGLRAQTGVYTDKAVKSVRSKVTNIRQYLAVDMQVEDFMELVFYSLKDVFSAQILTLDEKQLEQVNSLVDNKYNTWDWNFGYSPSYTFNKQIQWKGNPVKVYFCVERGGKIMDCEIVADNSEWSLTLSNALNGEWHKQQSIYDKLILTFPETNNEDLQYLTYNLF